MASNRTELTALKKLLSETDLILSTTTELPQNRTARCRELLHSALALTDDLLSSQAARSRHLGAQGRLCDRQARQCLLPQAGSPT
jgi:hypothetical protein